MANFKYRRIEQWIYEEIASGRFTSGMRIPTEPELMERFHVSRKTVRLAIDHLTKEGLLRKIQGSGTYIAERATGISGAPDPSPAPASSENASVALIMVDSSNYIFPEILRGASEVLAQNNYAMSVYFTENDYDMEYNIIRTLLLQRPAGVIMEPLTLGSLFVNHASYKMLAEQIPTIMIQNDKPDIFPTLSLRDRIGARKLTEYLLDLNHTQIGTIYCMNESTAHDRYFGFLDAMRAHGQHQSNQLALWPERQKLQDLFSPGGNLQLERMLNTATAVICHDDRIACSLISYLQRRGTQIPEDISVVGYDDSFFATLNVPLTTVTHPKAAYGRNAALALLALMHGEDADFHALEIEPELVVRASVQPA